MAIVASQPNTRFLLDQYDVSGWLNAGNQGWDNEIIESSNFTTTGTNNTVSGKYTEKAGETVFFDADVGTTSIDYILDAYARNDNPHYRGRAWGAHAEGGVIFETIEKLVTKPLTASEGQLLMMQGSWQQAGPTSRSAILRSTTAAAPITGTGVGTGVNQGAIIGTTPIYQAVFRVLGGTFTSITLQVHQSSDNGVGDAYTLMTGMTHTFTAPGVFRVTFTGASEAWKRAVVSAFTGTNAIVIVTGGRVKGT